MRIVLAATAAISMLFCVSEACAFGTVTILGQNAEHERITRHALGCNQPGGPAASDCFRGSALAEIAGSSGNFGAVGAPDNPLNGKLNDAKSHCDDGDYLATPGYPHSRADAEAALVACRNYMIAYRNEAVADAAGLVRNGRLVDAEIPTLLSCFFNFTKGRAYCNAIEDFGIVLHAAQDFYAHSNWVDQSDPKQPVSLQNPPGSRPFGTGTLARFAHGLSVPEWIDDGLLPGLVAGRHVGLHRPRHPLRPQQG